ISLTHQRLTSFPTRRSSDLDELKEWLGGVDFPASKEALVRHAQHQGAPEHVIEALQSIPATTYENRDQLSTSVPVSGGQTDAERSEEHTSELQSRFDLVCRL